MSLQESYKSRQVLKFFNIFLVAAIINFCLPKYAYADSATKGNDDDIEEPMIAPMKKGQQAPWDGLLLNSLAVATIKSELDNSEKECDLSIEKNVSLCKADCDFKIKEAEIAFEREKKILDASLQKNVKENMELKLQLDTLEKDKKNIYLWSAGGFLVGTLTTVLTVFALSQSTK